MLPTGMVLGRALAVVLLALAVGGCSALQESLQCPGEDCPEELRAVADDTAALDGVTAVDRAWRFSNLDHGHSGGVDVHAAVRTREEAGSLARAIAGIYRDSGVEPVDSISVVVVPDPELARPDDAETVRGGETPGAVSCAQDRCAARTEAFERAYADAAVADDAALESATWVSRAGAPETRIALTATADRLDQAGLRELEDRALDVAESAGLADIGDVRVLIRYQRRVEFAFTFHPRD
jgi:hypothetical protein